MGFSGGEQRDHLCLLLFVSVFSKLTHEVEKESFSLVNDFYSNDGTLTGSQKNFLKLHKIILAPGFCPLSLIKNAEVLAPLAKK